MIGIIKFKKANCCIVEREANKNDLFIIKYQQIYWEHNNTVGPKSISKQEFIREINKLTSL